MPRTRFQLRLPIILPQPRSSIVVTGSDPAIECLEASGIELLQASSCSAADLPHTILHRRHEVDSVIIAGGDGTLNAAAGALVETGLPLGILPTGTANDLARTLAISGDLPQAASVIAAGRRGRIDLGDVNGHPFFNFASIGLSAELARQLTREFMPLRPPRLCALRQGDRSAMNSRAAGGFEPAGLLRAIASSRLVDILGKGLSYRVAMLSFATFRRGLHHAGSLIAGN
jgi:hypothetical protein